MDVPESRVDGGHGVTETGDRGAVLITVALSLVALLAVSALAVDLGVALVSRRGAQNAADHAALSAAWADCHGTDATTAANDAVVNNDHQISELSLSESGGVQTAVVSRVVSLGFASVIGWDTMTVSGTASAGCSGSGGSTYAIFALGDDCNVTHGKDQIDVSGSNETINGGVHSNDNIQIGGSDNDFGTSNPGPDAVTYVNAFNDGGGGNDFDPGYPDQVGGVLPSPVEFELADYQPGSAAAISAGARYYYRNGDIDGSYIESRGDGLYYATGEIKLDKDLDADVTLVAEGFIEVSGSNQTLNPFVDGLLAFGGIQYTGIDRCDKFAVNMGGSTNDWNGIIYGPHGMIEMNGSSNTAVTGSLIGWSVRLNGSDLEISADPDLFPGDFEVKLLS